MATSAFKSTTRRDPIGSSSPSTDDSRTSSSSKAHRRSRSLSRFSRPIPAEIDSAVLPTPRRKFVNTERGSEFPEISLDDLAIEFFSGKDNSSELDDESGSSRSSRPVRVKSETSPAPASSQRRGRSVSRRNDDTASSSGGTIRALPRAEISSVTPSSQRRGRSVSRRNDGTPSNDGGTTRAAPNADSRRRRSVSVARYQISDSESDLDLSRSSIIQPKSRTINNDNSRVASFQRPTASSHRRLTRSMSQTPQRTHDGYSSHSSALTDDDSRDTRYGKNEIEKTIRAVYAQKKMDHPTGDNVDHGLYQAMRKELRSAVNEIMIGLEQTMERQPSALSVHDRLHSNKSNDLQTKKNNPTKSKEGQDGYKTVREVVPESKTNTNTQKVSYTRKRSNDRSRMSKRLNEEAERYLEDFISNIEDTDFSSFDGERSDTSSSLLLGTTTTEKTSINATKCNSVSVEMEGVNLPWLKWDDSHSVVVHPTTPKTKLWDPSQDLELIKEQSNGSWYPSAGSTNRRGGTKCEESKTPSTDMNKYLELKNSDQILFDTWRERNLIRSGGLLLCSPFI
ncbi:hypothetical protein LXL04_031928 [Taraxacum kok-saghyz]